MGRTALTFNSLLNRLRLIGVAVVMNPPAPSGTVYLFGEKPGIIPFARGPMYPVSDRPPDELIPARMIDRILKVLELNSEAQLAFWNVQEHLTSAPVNTVRQQK